MPDNHGTATLAELLTSADAVFEVGFAQSPIEAVFVRRAGPTLTSHDRRVSLEAIFDVRFFTTDAELHWWWDQQECVGRWAVLSDSSARDLGADLKRSIGGHRLLRGTVIDKRTMPSWSMIHDGHSRPLWLPLAAAEGKRVALGVIEYVKLDTHGNAGVFAERFTTWEVR